MAIDSDSLEAKHVAQRPRLGSLDDVSEEAEAPVDPLDDRKPPYAISVVRQLLSEDDDLPEYRDSHEEEEPTFFAEATVPGDALKKAEVAVTKDAESGEGLEGEEDVEEEEPTFFDSLELPFLDSMESHPEQTPSDPDTNSALKDLAGQE